ncbi:glycosyltransferase [Kitasatospora purpeofusca]|uniref:glycosyltransferase n=1 Tax=Kitasatospora purpeofusca TaxID=67352 RepID=UPI003686C074
MVDQLAGSRPPDAAGPGTAAGRRTGRARPSAAAPGGPGPLALFARLALPAAVLLWLLALPRTRTAHMGALGLVGALPGLYWAGLALLTAGFTAVLAERGTRRRWAPGYVLALIAFVHATPTLLYPELRYAWAWKHVMVVDAMLRHDGSVPDAGALDAYNQWPGFFQLNVLFLRATGLHSALGYAAWYPVLANVLLLGPLLLVLRTVTTDGRLVWGGVWIYYSASWVGQDYFSPQAFSYLLFLAVLALVLRRLSAGRRAAEGSGPEGSGTEGSGAAGKPGIRRWAARKRAAGERGAAPEGSAAGGARALTWTTDLPPHGGWRPLPFALVVVLIAAIVCSHQLTPLMLISALVMLALPRRNRRVVLPVLAAAVALTLAWDATVARPYLSKNLGDLVAALASPDNNALPGLQRLARPAEAQVFASWVDRGLTAAVLLLALAALVRHRWTRRTSLPLLLAAPVPLLLANSYGGEMVFRAYLFALPAAAMLAATVLIPTGAASAGAVPVGTVPAPVAPAGAAPAADAVRAAGPRTPGPARWGLTLLALLGLLFGLVFGYYGKEAMNRFTPGEAAAVRYVAQTAPAGSRIVSVTADLPGGEARYDELGRLALSAGTPQDRLQLVRDPAAAVGAALADPTVTGPSYLVLTPAQTAECRLTGVLPADTVDRVRAVAAASPSLRVVFADGDSVVYQYSARTAGPGPTEGGGR